MGIEALRKEVKTAQDAWVAAADKAKSGVQEDREARDAAKTKYSDLAAQLEAAEVQHQSDLNEAKEAEKAAADLKAGLGRKTDPGAGLEGSPKTKADLKSHGFERDPKCGFEDHQDFIVAVRQATILKQGDDRLSYLSRKRFAAAGSDEHSTFSDPYGGFLVPESFSFDVKTTMMEADPISSRVTSIPMATRKVTFPARVDKNRTTSVSGGLAVYRRAEADTVAASRMQFETISLEATELFGVTYATEELLEESAVSFVAMLEAGFRDEFTSKMISEKMSGTGVGKPMGVLNAPCTIEVAKESMQAADTINSANILNMRKRAWRYGNSIWLANHDTYTQLINLVLAFTNSDIPLFAPGNGVDVPDTLLGRPIYFTEHVPTAGDVGDIGLYDWSQYLYGLYKPLRNASSMHVRFLEHEQTFKFWLADAGAPWWKTAMTPKNGANTLSPFVTLAARA